MRKLQFKVLAIVSVIVLIESFSIGRALASTLEESQNPQETLLTVYLNGENLHEVKIFLQTSNHQLWIARENLMQWDLDLPAKKHEVMYQGQSYYPISAFTEAAYTIDQKEMAIHLNFKPASFTAHNFEFPKDTVPMPTKPGFGAFMNYDLFQQEYPDSSTSSGIFSPGIFTPVGTVTSNVLAQRVKELNYDQQNIIRLNTQWVTDYPDKMKTLRLGDTYSTPGLWGNSVGFGGIQWGTNFATRPDFVTYPLPSTKGMAVVPSTVDLYVNNVLTNNKNMPIGPFSMNAIPVISGSGTVNVVTTDLLGRQQVVSLPYYASDQLLKPGLHDYSLEAGFIRNNFGSRSNDYGEFSAIGTDNIGITDKFTGQWHTELQENQQNIGVGGNYLVGNMGIFSSSVAISQGQRKMGQLLLLGFQRQSFQGVNYGVRMQTTTQNFRQIGLEDNQHAPAMTGQFFLGFPLKNGASIGASYTQQNNRDSPNVGLINVSYNQSLFEKWSLSLSTVATVKGPTNRAVFLTLTRALDNRTTMNIGANRQTEGNQGTVQLDRNLPLGTGWGYNLYAGQGENTDYQATVTGQNNVGTYSAGVAQQQGIRGYQMEAKGGMAVFNKHVYLSRTLGNSFGVVQIPGHSHVRVYEHNQEIGQTDANGEAFIPDLLPYQNNPIKIADSDLSLDTGIKSTEIKAVPYNNSGLIMKFPVESSYNVLMTLMQSSGKPIPAGAVIEGLENPSQGIVANDGEVYLTNLKMGKNNYKAIWDEQLCYFSVNYQKTKDPLPNLGVVTCQEKHSV